MKNPPTIVKKLFLINLLNNCFWLSSVVTFFYIHRGLNYTEILTLSALLSVIIIIFEIPTGIFADKYGRKNSMIFASICTIIAMSIYMFANSMLLFSLSFAILGIGITFASGATEALLYDALKAEGKEKQAHEAMGHFFSAEVLAGVITPPIASIIARNLTEPQFLVLIVLSIICYAIGLLITTTLKDIKDRENYPRKKIAYKDIKNFLKNRALRTLTINKLLVGVSMAIFVILWQPQLKASGVPIILFGVFLAVGSLGIFLVNRKIGWLSSKINTKPLLFISAVIPGLLFFILAFIYNSIMTVSAYLIIRIVAAIREPILSKYINKEIKSERRATTLSLISMITALAVLILNPFIGIATDKNLSYGFILLGILCLSVEIIVPITKKIIRESM